MWETSTELLNSTNVNAKFVFLSLIIQSTASHNKPPTSEGVLCICKN